MIDFLMLALFVAQPQVPGAGTPEAAAAAASRPPMLGTVPLRNPVEITARLVTGDRTQAIFSGDVLVRHKTLQLRCERMTAHYTSANQEVQRVVCTGGVQAVDGERHARGERAEYDVPAGVLTVTGAPEARQGTTYMTGTKVRLTLGRERLEVENARIVVETAPLKAKGAPGGARQP